MEQAAGEVPRVEKKGKGRMVGILVALVLVLSAGAAGAVFAPRLLSKPAPEKVEGEEEGAEHGEEAAAEEHAEKDKEEASEPAADSSASRRRKGPVGEVYELSPVVVDIHANDNSLRHIKVQIAVELPKGKIADEFKKLVPFAREAAISYLRTQEYDRLADPKAFDAIKKELETEVVEAVGKREARRVLIVDFVVQ